MVVSMAFMPAPILAKESPLMALPKAAHLASSGAAMRLLSAIIRENIDRLSVVLLAERNNPPSLTSVPPSANFSMARGPSRPATTSSSEPPAAAATAVTAAMRVRVDVSSGLARIQLPVTWIISVMRWMIPRIGPFSVSIIWMPTSSHAEVRLSRSPMALSAMTLATLPASPWDCFKVAMSSCSLPDPACSVSTARAAKASSPAMALK